MKKYHDNNKSYGAIVEAMQQIRYNALVEEYGEDEMEEALMYEAEMGGMSDDEEEAVAQLMDEALYEMDMDDDEDNLNEADDDRKTRRRRRLRQALLIGAGLAAGGLAAAPLAFAGKGVKYAGAPEGEGAFGAALRGAGNLGTRYMSGVSNLGSAAGAGYQAGRDKLGNMNLSGLTGLIPKFGKGNK
jgi:hypothetical protein